MGSPLRFDIDPTRPEEQHASPLEYFTPQRAREYAASKSMRRAQQKLLARVLELIEIDPSEWILDLGCGTGFGQEALTSLGLRVIGVDVAAPMLQLGVPASGPRVCADMTFLPFRNGTFDGIISVSAIQWLLREEQVLRKRALSDLFQELHRALLARGTTAIQFYPRTGQVLDDLKEAFRGDDWEKSDLIIDNPRNPRKRKIFLVATKQA